MTITLDFETRSEADLKRVGAWAYAEHSSTEIICASWAVDDGPITDWINPALAECGEALEELGYTPIQGRPEMPSDLRAAIQCHNTEAHNVGFEYSIWYNICHLRWGWPMILIEDWRDTMAVACYYAMPPALDNLCRVLGLPGKDAGGAKLITKYSKLNLKTATRIIPAEDLHAFSGVYCHKDVEQERACGDILGELPEEELEIFTNDLAINVRGIPLDPRGIISAQAVVAVRAKELEEEFEELTGWRPTQRDRVLAWLLGEGLELPNLQAATIDELLDEGRIGEREGVGLSSLARRALELRRAHARASIKKLDAMMRQRSRDGRARFQTRYHGAVTGRNTGTGFQPLNLARGYDKVEPDQLVRDISYEDPVWLDCLYGDAMDAVAKASRHWIMAHDGRMIVADFSSIEAVINACLAGEEWKVDLFREPNPRPYEIAAERIHNLPAGTVTKDTHPEERQDGKKCELAFGFGGAIGAWRRFDRSLRHDDATVLGFVRGWRKLHPAIVKSWYALDDAALEAVIHPGRVTGGNDEAWFERVDGWLTMILPDGKRIWYWAPEVRMVWHQSHLMMKTPECRDGSCDCRKVQAVTYMAQKEGRWRRTTSYGGKWCENRVQATARQILKAAELRVRDAGYLQVLGVYDEANCEMPDGRGSVEELLEIMNEPAGAWCARWPIQAHAWEGTRYKK